MKPLLAGILCAISSAGAVAQRSAPAEWRDGSPESIRITTAWMSCPVAYATINLQTEPDDGKLLDAAFASCVVQEKALIDLHEQGLPKDQRESQFELRNAVRKGLLGTINRLRDDKRPGSATLELGKCLVQSFPASVTAPGYENAFNAAVQKCSDAEAKASLTLQDIGPERAAVVIKAMEDAFRLQLRVKIVN